MIEMPWVDHPLYKNDAVGDRSLCDGDAVGNNLLYDCNAAGDPSLYSSDAVGGHLLYNCERPIAI